MKKFRFLPLLLIICLLFSSIPAYAQYEPLFDVQSKAVYLVNLDTGNVIYEKNADAKMYPASLTKIMTAIVVLENIDDLDGTEITFKPYLEVMMSEKNAQYGGISLGGLYRGDTLTARELLYAMMLPSANEAAVILADYVGDGSLDYFYDLMNQKAQELGCTGTHFSSANGLHEADNYTTAKDMYLITRYAMQNPDFAEIVSTTFYDGGLNIKGQNLYWNTTNKMMVKGSGYYYPYITGVKTGTTEEAGRCIVTTASRDGYSYLMVVMGAPMEGDTNIAMEETQKLYDWVFLTFRVKTITEQGESLVEVPLKLSWNKDHLKLMSGERFQALIPDDIDVASLTTEYELPNYIKAPIKKGDFVGYLHFSLAGEELGQVELVSMENVDRNIFLFYVDLLSTMLRAYWFKFVVVFAVLSTLCYVGLMFLQQKGKRRYKPVRRRKNL